MKLHTILFIFLGIINVSGQPIITGTDIMPSIGDEYINYLIDFEVPPSGIDMVWDYSNVELGTSSITKVIDPINSGINNLPASTTYCLSTSGNVDCFKHNLDTMERTGSRAGITFMHKDSELLYKFPFSQGSTSEDAFSFTYSTFGYPSIRSGICKSSVIGYGMLKLPSNISGGGVLEYHDVVLVKTTEEINDTVDYGTSGIYGYKIATTVYNFYTAGVKRGLLNFATVEGATSITNYGLVTFDQTINNVEDAKMDKSFKIFPTKVRENLYVYSDKLGSTEIEYHIVSNNGMKISSGTIENGAPIDLGQLTGGMYTILVSGSNMITSSRFVKE